MARRENSASDCSESLRQQASLPARNSRARSGLLGLFRPQKTVSPLTHQASQDVTHAAKQDLPLRTSRSAAQGGASADQAETCSSWSTLPEHLVEAVMQLLLKASNPPHSFSKEDKQTQFAVTSVSRSWRQIGRRTFFRSIWNGAASIRHPVQLLGLSPAPVLSFAQLVKCVMKREYDPSQKKSVKYTLRQGDRLSNSIFLMTALQISRLDVRIYLSSSCTGTPCARIETNLLGTRYEVILDSTVQPFAQHEAMHSHTPLLTYDRLLSVQRGHSMQSMQSVNDAFDVPVLDLPSSSADNLAPSTPSPLQSPFHSSPDQSHSTAASVIPPDLLDTFESAIDPTNVNDTQDDPLSSTLSSPRGSGLLTKFKSWGQHAPASPLQSPFAAVATTSQQTNSGANTPASPDASSSQTGTRLIARCQSALEGIYPGRSQARSLFPPTTPRSPASPSLLARARSDRTQGNSPAEGHSVAASCSCQTVPKSVGGVQYKTRIRGFMRPRRMMVSLPPPAALACFDTSANSSSCSAGLSRELRSRVLVPSTSGREPQSPTTPDQSGASDRSPQSPGTPNSPPHQAPQSSSSASTSQAPSAPCTPTHSQTNTAAAATSKAGSNLHKGIELRNKPPHWNDTLRCWCLNFRGRVKLASVKNFQLIKADDPSKAIVMQFGKVDTSTYIMDYNPTEINAVQAFAISLSTFDTKLLL